MSSVKGVEYKKGLLFLEGKVRDMSAERNKNATLF